MGIQKALKQTTNTHIQNEHSLRTNEALHRDDASQHARHDGTNEPALRQFAGKRGRWGHRSSSRDKSEEGNCIKIPLCRFNAEQVKLNMNAKGLITVTASKEETNDTKRNGQRKTTTLVEETCQLPGYVIDGKDLLKQVESKFVNGHLVISY